MANEVYANMMEVACKAGSGQSICAFPDVCMTPPQTPATPPGVPIPYPNTGMDSDATEGSRSVQISGQEVVLKNQSYFKRSAGDEAGVAPQKGLLTSVNMGKVFFNMWSMDVECEGENVVRNLDLTTHNHGSFPGNSPTWPFIAKQTVTKGIGPCQDEIAQEKEACKGCEDPCASKECRTARKCMLVPYKPDPEKPQQVGCCESPHKFTPHHLVEVHSFTAIGGRSAGARIPPFDSKDKLKRYDDQRAPCVCCHNSSRYHGDHGTMHAVQGAWERQHMDADAGRSQMGGDGSWTYGEAKKGATMAINTTFPDAHCSEACISAQLDNYHHQVGVKDDDTKLRADRSPLTDRQKIKGEAVLDQAEADGWT